MTLHLDSLGVTLQNVAQDPELGGYQLTPPKIWIHAQFGLPFHKFDGLSYFY